MSRVTLSAAAALALQVSFGAVVFPGAAAAAPQITCGSGYIIAPGNTLYEIAIWAYGRGDRYREIYRANQELLRDERTVAVGEELLIPCLDGDASNATPDTEADISVQDAAKGLAAPVQRIAENQRMPQLVDQQIRFLTGSGFAPFVDKGSKAGGMITDLVARAVGTAAPQQDFRVSFVNDWPAHLEVLLRDGAYDVGFPWYKPDCSATENLSDSLRMRCDEFDFSAPFYEVTVGFYTRAGDRLTNTVSHAGLFGKRVCRPEVHFLIDLDHYGLKAPDVLIETAGSARECLTRLAKGQVDVVSLVKTEADRLFRYNGMADRVAEIPNLASRQTLHALVLKSNPNGRAYLDIIDQGLASLMMSGEWFAAVAQHGRPHILQMN